MMDPFKQFGYFYYLSSSTRKKIKNKLFPIYRFICFETSRFDENFTDEMSQMNKIHFVSSSARFLIGNSCRSIRRLKKNSNKLFNFIIKERNATLWWKFIHHEAFHQSTFHPFLIVSDFFHCRRYIKKKKRKKCFNFIIKGRNFTLR